MFSSSTLKHALESALSVIITHQNNKNKTMQKTLSQLKKDIEIGKSILLISFKERNYNTKELEIREIPPKLAGMRLIVAKDTVKFKMQNTNNQVSNCEWPTAKNLEYNGSLFTIKEIAHNGDIWQLRTYKLFNN
jgi:hypothetical protein